MTLKEYEEAKAGKSPYEYQKWFDERAWFAVDIGGIEQPCMKLTSRKVTLRDGGIYVNDRNKKIRRSGDSEKRSLRYRYEMMQTYDEIDTMDRVSLREYLELLKRKTAMERELKRREELSEGTIYCAVDTTAAGDTFTGYFLASIMMGKPIPVCMERAAKASAISVQRYGAADSIPAAEEVDGNSGNTVE